MKKQTIAMFLAAFGILFFMAVPFNILAQNVGTFGGLACFVLSGFVWAFWPASAKEK